LKPISKTCLTDAESFVNLTPADYNIDALEDSRVLLLAKSDTDYPVSRIPGLKGLGLARSGSSARSLIAA
jgi:hypothetical protein